MIERRRKKVSGVIYEYKFEGNWLLSELLLKHDKCVIDSITLSRRLSRYFNETEIKTKMIDILSIISTPKKINNIPKKEIIFEKKI